MVMAAGEGATSSAYEGGGGVGGKFKRRPLRRSQTTPYERPPTALRNPSWLSKLVVEPASKLISAGAQRFYSSLFRKRLTHPPPSPLASPQPPEENQESRNGLQETVPDNHAGPQEPANIVGANSNCNNETTNGISELEQLLREKSFTKSEIACLTELLHSRAVDSPVKDDGVMSEANLSIQNNFPKPMPDTRKRQEFPIPLEGNKIETVRANGAVTTPFLRKTILEDDIAAPAELAKAYMGSRPSKVSPSKLGLRSQIAREDAVLLNNSFTSKSPITSLALETTGHLGISRNGFTTPRSRGRSAIYNMARTPYSRVQPTAIQKVSGSRNYDYGGPSSSPSQSVWESSGLVSFKPASLKRRSSVFEDDIGSVGPIRRIRQKSNLSSHRTSLTSRGASLASVASQLHKLPLMETTENSVSNALSKNYAQIPRASSEMAARIFEQLDKMTPKEKSSESKLAAARGTSPLKLTPNMLHGQALSSLENLDASKLLQISQGEHKLGGQPMNSLPDPHVYTTHKQGRVEENGPAKFVHPPSTEEAAKPTFTPLSSERKRAFKMSAHEDFLDLDDDVRSNEPTSISAEGKGLEKSMMVSKSIAGESSSDKTPVVSEVKTHPVPLLLKKTELDISNAPTAAADKSTTASDSPLLVSFGLKNIGSVPSPSESKAEKSTSLMNVYTSDRSATKSTQLLDATVNGQLGTVPASTNSIFSTGASSDLFSNNGNLGSSASTLSSSFSPISSNINSTNSSSSFVFSTGTTAISTTDSITSTSAASDSGLFVANVAPSTSGALVFKDSLSAISAVSTIANAETTDSKFNAGKENGFDKSSYSSFESKTSTAVNAGSSVFGLNTSTSSAADSSQLQGFVGASGSSITTQPSPAGSGLATASQSIPFQFGSSSSPTVFGASGITSLTSSSVFGSSAPAAKVSDSSASTSETNLINSSSSGSSVFKFGVGSSEANAISSNSTAIPGSTFAFGASSSASVPAISSSIGNGVFNFGAGSAVSSSPANAGSTSSIGATPSIFSFGASKPASSSEANTVSSAGASLSTFSSGWPSSNSPVFGSTSSTFSPSTGVSFGASSSLFGSSPMGFGSTNAASSSPIFSFSSVAATTSLPSPSTQSVFGNSANPFAPSPANNDQMSAEDSMSEDRQSPTPAASVFGQSSGFMFGSPAAPSPAPTPAAAPVFGQSSISPSPPGFMFGSTVQSPAAPFQFGGQPNQAAPQTPTQFQPSGSLDFNVGGSFSLGSGAPDKSGRRIVKPNRNRIKKR